MQKVRLLSVCDVYQPQTIATKEFCPTGKYIVYGANGAIGRYTKYNHAESEILMACRGATCGAINVSQPYSWINGNAMVITPNGTIDISKKYLQYYLIYCNKDDIITGTAQPQITRQNLKDFQIVICDIEEQKRIVDKIEELFSELDNGVETLKKTKQQLAVYRQAVLKDVFSNCEKWDKYCFSNLMKEVRNGYGQKPDDCGEYSILKISAVRPLNLDLSESRLNKTQFSAEDTIEENDILFTRYNGSKEYVGVCAVVPKLNKPYAYPDKLIKCRPKIQNSIHSKYIAYYMSQGNARKYLRGKIKTTSGQNGIAGADIKKTIVYLPNFEKQSKIVAEIETRLSVCDSIEKTVDTALQQAEAMRQSILKKAFEGEL